MNGEGIDKSLDLASTYFEKAAENGHDTS